VRFTGHGRYSTGYKLANDGHDARALQHYMGHKISCTRCVTPKWLRIDSKIFGRTEYKNPRTSVPFEFEFGDIEAKRGVAVGWLEIDDLEFHAELQLGPVFDVFEIDIPGGSQMQFLTVIGANR
jgi:hypothetical protein